MRSMCNFYIMLLKKSFNISSINIQINVFLKKCSGIQLIRASLDTQSGSGLPFRVVPGSSEKFSANTSRKSVKTFASWNVNLFQTSIFIMQRQMFPINLV